MIFEIKKSINGNLHLVNYAGLSQTLLECLLWSAIWCKENRRMPDGRNYLAFYELRVC